MAVEIARNRWKSGKKLAKIRGMKPPTDNPEATQHDLFRSELRQMIDLRHPLVKLAERIDWSRFDEQFGATYCEEHGRPGIRTRQMVALTYLKYTHDLSDDDTVQGWVEDPYWQYLSGARFFEHELPINSSSMTRWRKRIGEAGAEAMLSETIEVGKRLGIKLRQGYGRVGRKVLLKQSRYAHAKQYRRARTCTKKLRTYLGRVIRDMERKAKAGNAELKSLLAVSRRICEQKREDKGKVYSVHAPEVECISKGKAHKRYEFGCKVSVAATSRGGWFVGARAFHDNPYDGHTLSDAMEQVVRVTGVEPDHAFADRGYRGHDYTGSCVIHAIEGHSRRSVQRGAQRVGDEPVEIGQKTARFLAPDRHRAL